VSTPNAGTVIRQAPIPSLLEVSDLYADLAGNPVLRGVDLAVGTGEAVGLLGRNGMGKTTLIRTLLGLVPCAGGQVRFDGCQCRGARPETMARLGIGYVPEGRRIFSSLSVRENLVMSARPAFDGSYAWTLERVLAVFPRLAQRLNRGGQQLSGGEQQMVAIGRALMTNPRLLILDEATEGLAPLLVREIWGILSGLRGTSMAVIVVDRNFRAVLAHTDRCVVMQKGKIVLAGRSAELRGREEELTALLGV
jgi:branched-chain amino acid transport system ATP-binding protein